MNLEKTLKKFPNFKINGREGGRVGYYCGGCKKPFSVKEAYRHFSFEYGSQFARVRCRVTGSEDADSIYDE